MLCLCLFTLSVHAFLALLVLGDLVGSVSPALLGGAESVLGLRDGNHLCLSVCGKEEWLN